MRDILLVGAPNSGKSALFNRLTGLKHKVANYPGITIDVGKGHLVSDTNVSLWDFPGTYSLTAVSGEEQVAIDNLRCALNDDREAIIAMVLDATRLEKGLTYCLQVAHHRPLRHLVGPRPTVSVITSWMFLCPGLAIFI